MKYYIYIIKSEKEDWYYVGFTKDIDSRLRTHNSGRVRSTKSRRPYKIVHLETADGRQSARKREKQLKNGFAKKRILKVWWM